MTENTRPQYAEIEQPFGVEPPDVHCPICGRLTFDSEGTVDACEHLAWIHHDQGGSVYVSEDFKARVLANDQKVEDGNTKELLVALGYGNELLALEITYGGMACGPTWSTIVYCFDYDTLAK